MNYYQLLAVLSIDGCLLNLTPESHWALMASLYTIPEYEELARSEQTDKMALSSQNDEWDEWDDYPTIEANRSNIAQISKLLQEGKIRIYRPNSGR